MYLMTCTRPDLAYLLSLLARYVAPGRHQKVHWDAAKRVLHYLCSTSGMGLVLGGRGPVVLTGHADASWVDDSATQRSSQGYTFSLCSGSVSWRSTRSSSVLSSSCEAEIYAGAMAAQELRWLTYLLTDLGEQPCSPPVLYVDNKAMIALCQEHRLEHRMKHIALGYFLARELQQRGQLCLAYVATRANTADIFTKALPRAFFAFLTGLVTTCSPPLCLWGVSTCTQLFHSSFILVHHFDRFVWVMPVAKKSDVLREFLNKAIVQNLTCPYFPQQNIMAEREMRTAVESVRTMLLHMGVQHHWWHLALRQAVWVCNCLERATTPPGMTPYQLLTGKKPHLTLARVWGCMVQFMVPEQHRDGKLASKARWGFSLGVSPESKGWEVLHLIDNKVVTSVKVIFYETLSLEVWKVKFGPASGRTQAHPPTDTSTAIAPLLAKVDEPADEDVVQVLPPPLVLAPPFPIGDRPAGIANGRQGTKLIDQDGKPSLTGEQQTGELPTSAGEPLRAEAVAAAVVQGTRRYAARRWLEEESGRRGALLQGRVVCWVLVYVDDLLAASSSPAMLKELKELPEAAFELREISPVVKYLGLEIVRDRLARKLWLHQQGYADKLRRRFIDEEQGSRVPKTPVSVDAYDELTFDDDEAQEREEEEYRQKVGSLQFAATTTRPDIAFACKARYVARSFSQRQGVDFFQTFSPTPKMTTLRGSLHEEIWLRHPPGFTGSFSASTQCSLRRPVYGLRQAPRKWHDTLMTTLAALGFAPSTVDTSLFLRTNTLLPPFYVLVYVDDLVFATADTEAMAIMKCELQNRHTCTDLGELRSYLGLQITRDRARHTITLTQSHMVHQVLKHFGFRYSSPQSTPLPTGQLLSAPLSDESVELSGLYPELVGCLISSCEAEIYAGAMAAQELRWLTYLLTDLGERPRSLPVLYVDNKAMIALCQEHRLEHRTKHIALCYFLAR
ncbi:unnamed protein product [Closterium sp. NIES-53]